MVYADIREDIRSGDLLAWSHRGWGSWYDLQIQAVRMGTRSEYCHVGNAWCVGGRVFVLEAVTAGVRIFPLSRSGDFYWLPMEVEWTPDAEEFALAQIGEEYSKWLAIRSFLGSIPRTDDHIWMCSKYSNMILQKLGVDYGKALRPDSLVQAALRDNKRLVYVDNPGR